METLPMSGIIGAALSNKKSWHEPLLLGQIVHYCTEMMAEETPLEYRLCADLAGSNGPFVSTSV